MRRANVAATRDPRAQEVSGGSALQRSRRLGAILCWAIIFADVGTSIYYVPGILYGVVGPLTGLFVLATLLVFVLLALKYAEVTYRFPQGGGVVTVASRALNPWFGALGGIFILVDYFLTAAISCLSGMLYLSVVVSALGPQTELIGLSATVWITVTVLVALGVLNWLGIGASARVSVLAALIALFSDLAVLFTVFSQVSLDDLWRRIEALFFSVSLTPTLALVGFAGSFLAFSGLESVAQLAPDMKRPRKAVSIGAMTLVVLTVGLTTPLLALFSTALLPEAAADPVQSSQLISLLAGKWGVITLQIEVAISASALLIFAANTAIIGAYHVFLAMARLEFLPTALLRRNRMRGTPHFAIGLATLIPIAVLISVHGDIATLGDLYAFGLLGAFTLTSLGMDIIRVRERSDRRMGRDPDRGVADPSTTATDAPESSGAWARSWVNLQVGFLTTALVLSAWLINLVAKPLATIFGASALALGLSIAAAQHLLRRRRGHLPVVATGVESGFLVRALAVLAGDDAQVSEEVIRRAVQDARSDDPVGHDGVLFLYVGEAGNMEPPGVFRLAESHLHDRHARTALGRANYLSHAARVPARFIYRHAGPDAVAQVWRFAQPLETLIASSWQALSQGIPQTGLVIVPDETDAQ